MYDLNNETTWAYLQICEGVYIKKKLFKNLDLEERKLGDFAKKKKKMKSSKMIDISHGQREPLLN